MLKLNNQENIEQKNCILPSNYDFAIFSLIWMMNTDENWKKDYILEFSSIATKSIEFELKQEIEKVKNNIISVLNIYNYSIEKTKEETFQKLLNYLTNLANESSKNNKTLILWFSSLWWYELMYKFFDLIKKIKKNYPNVIFVIWWVDFNKIKDISFINKIYDWWVDIINVWWAKEFVEFFGNIWTWDKFFRNENKELFLETKKEIPWNLLFKNWKNDFLNITPWKHIDTSFYYDEIKNSFHFLIKNSWCLNTCHYCVNDNDKNNNTNKQDIQDSIINFNNFISNIKNDKISVAIDNPNPIQFINKFYDFISNIDLSKVNEIWFFSDFIWLWNDYKYVKLIEIINYLKEKYPNILITISFSIDALHYELDWEFIWRAYGKKLASEELLQKWYNNFIEFVWEYTNDKRVFIWYNIILHPNMTIELLKERLLLINQLNQLFSWVHLLSPIINTKIYDDHKWYFIEEFEASNFFESEKNFPEISLWWYYYLNSYLLDVYTFANNFWLLWIFEELINNNQNELEQSKSEILIAFLKWWKQKIEKENNDLFSFVKFIKNPILSIQGYFFNKKYIKTFVDYAIYFINFIINRENYIIKNNSLYKNIEHDLFLTNLEIKKKEFEELREKI